MLIKKTLTHTNLELSTPVALLVNCAGVDARHDLKDSVVVCVMHYIVHASAIVYLDSSTTTTSHQKLYIITIRH